MRRILLLLTALLLSAWTLSAQRLTDRDEYRGVYRHYDFELGTPDTPAPKGYRPFYISHYGRHGSRFPVDRHYMQNAIIYLEPAEKAGLLTEKGRMALESYRKLDTICMSFAYGDISERGAMEHRQIASWMASRWPRVFSDRRRQDVDVDCSYLPRCIHSMENFTSSLSESFPKLQYDIDTSKATYGWLVNNESVKKATHGARVAVENEWGKDFDMSPFYASLFTDPDKVLPMLPGSPYMLCEVLYTNATMVPLYAPDSGIDLMSLFSEDQFREIAKWYNNKTWGGHCNSAEFGSWRIHRMDSLLVRYVTDADAAIKGNGVAANLRFGHDTSLMPLLCLMGIKDFHEQVPIAAADSIFNAGVDMTMAANLVMVFYRNRKGDVLVKFVHSGRETTIPALTPVQGPYYRWADVREWFLERAGRA